MFQLAKRTSDLVMDLPPETFVGAMLLSLVVAMLTAGAYYWLAQRKPTSLTLLVCLVLLANLACVVATVHLVQSAVPTVRLVAWRGRPPKARIVNLYDRFRAPDAARK
jgi:apolipoprotein N-acyltransferase